MRHRSGARRTGLLVATLVLVATSAACGAADPPVAPVTELATAPPVVLHAVDGDVGLAAWTVCWKTATAGYCGDGFPPEHPVDAGTSASVDLSFPVEGWDFSAASEDGPGLTTHPVDETTWRVSLADPSSAPSGEVVVHASGYGPQGDVHVTFRWTPEGGVSDGGE